MFREMARKKQQLPEAECLELLEQEPRGVLSVLGDEGYPYGMPINFWYCRESGKLYFHTGKTGHRTDSLKNFDKASFCVYDQGYRKPGEWALNIRSVIVFGRVRPVEDREQAIGITRKLSYKYTQDGAYIEEEISKYGSGVVCWEMTPEHITGKLVNES